MEKKQFVSDLKAKETVDSLFMVKHIAVMNSRDGKSYLNIVLADNGGDIEGRKWHDAEKVSSLVERGDFVWVKGKVNLFQNRLQVIAKDIMALDEAEIEKLDHNDFITKSQNDADKMYNELVDIVDKLDDVYIKELLNSVLYDGEVSRRLKLWPAGKTIHHAYQSGLLEHILSCSNLAVSLSAHYKVNQSYVVAGCILHDICKIYELSEGPMVEYTDEGKLVGHLVKAVELIDHYASKINNFPHSIKVHLKHICLAHHGEYAYGSPKIPQTSEAYLVHLIDFMDSKLATFENIKKNDSNVGKWSSFVKHLDRIVYKEELPTYTEHITEDEATNSKAESKNNKSEFSNTMSEMLEGFQVETEE
jgi:3'-5' exoribonuclease